MSWPQGSDVALPLISVPKGPGDNRHISRIACAYRRGVVLNLSRDLRWQAVIAARG